jgi:hypothetical protein
MNKTRLAGLVLKEGLAEATARLSCGRMVPSQPWSPVLDAVSSAARQ